MFVTILNIVLFYLLLYLKCVHFKCTKVKFYIVILARNNQYLITDIGSYETCPRYVNNKKVINMYLRIRRDRPWAVVYDPRRGPTALSQIKRQPLIYDIQLAGGHVRINLYDDACQTSYVRPTLEPRWPLR